MHVVQCRTRTDASAMRGKPLLPEHLPAVSSAGDLTVLKPNGDTLLVILRGAVAELSQGAFDHLRFAAERFGSDNRALYAGIPRQYTRKVDGTVSTQGRTRSPEGKLITIPSAVVGFFDRQGGRHPYCRETMFSREQVERWREIVPLVQAVDAAYAKAAPAKYAKQRAAADTVHAAWKIGTSAFTTLTINSNVLGSIHQDQGDFKDGLGCITVHRRGFYRGGVLGFPEYGVGAELHDGDLILFNPHDWHGVTAMEDASEDACRVSVVYYMRSRMRDCGSPLEELKRAEEMKHKQGLVMK